MIKAELKKEKEKKKKRNTNFKHGEKANHTKI